MRSKMAQPCRCRSSLQLSPYACIGVGKSPDLQQLTTKTIASGSQFSFYLCLATLCLTSVFGKVIRPEAISAATDCCIASRLENRGLYPRRRRLFSMETQELRMICPQDDSASRLSRPSFH